MNLRTTNPPPLPPRVRPWSDTIEQVLILACAPQLVYQSPHNVCVNHIDKGERDVSPW